MPGEIDFIRWLRSQTKANDFVRISQGDDLAVLDWRNKGLLLVGADQVLDGVHFDSTRHSPRDIGRKAMNRNLSDCAAMACLPAAAIATVALPTGAGVDYAKELYLGLREAADPFDCPIVGGDTGSWPGKLALSVTILCKTDGIAPVTRSGGHAGEAIYTTGPLGGSILGRHLSFQPRVQLARQLARDFGVSSMIDLSDGLSRDLLHLCTESHLGAVLDADAIPIHADAELMSRQDNRPALDHALHDGEDYELLFTSAAAIPPNLARQIGITTVEPGIYLQTQEDRRPLKPEAWEHRL